MLIEIEKMLNNFIAAQLRITPVSIPFFYLLFSVLQVTTTQQSIHYRIPCIWNSIPDEIKNSSSAVRFKIKYKRFLTNNYED